jgi:hypothetical protein
MTDTPGHVIYLKAAVGTGPADRHDIGWLPSEGWFCVTCAHNRCDRIAAVKNLTT